MLARDEFDVAAADADVGELAIAHAGQLTHRFAVARQALSFSAMVLIEVMAFSFVLAFRLPNASGASRPVRCNIGSGSREKKG